MMFGSSDDSYDKDRATNMSAVTVQLGVTARTMDTRESYEQTYNTGCNYDYEGDWVATEEALTSNEKAIKEYWEDDVGIIKGSSRIQRQGREREAHTIYKLLRNEPSDIGLTTVANKNLIAAIKGSEHL